MSLLFENFASIGCVSVLIFIYQLGGVAKVQSSSSEVVWPLREKESNDIWYSRSKMCTEGIQSSLNLDLSLSLFGVSQEGNKNVFMGSRPPSFSSPLQPGSSRAGFRFFNDVSMETQSMHGSFVSMRSRTKVKFIEYIGYLVYLFCYYKFYLMSFEFLLRRCLWKELMLVAMWTLLR